MKSLRDPLDFEKLSWPVARLGEALEWLTHRSGLSSRAAELPCAPPDTEDLTVWNAWIDGAAHALAVESELVQSSYAEVEAFVKSPGPSLLKVRVDSKSRFLAVLGGGRKRVSLLGPDLASHSVDPESLRALLCEDIERPLLAETERTLDGAGIPRSRRPAVRAAILRQQLSGALVSGCWLLRLSPAASPWQQARDACLPSRLVGLLAAHTLQYLLGLLSWWMIGKAALEGRFDWGWLAAWALVLGSMIPFRLLVIWWQGSLSIRIGALLKRRLLFGALQLQPEEIRHQGAGQLLGCVIESEAVESLALSGGFLALMAGLELILAAVVMACGAGGLRQSLLLLVWVAVTTGIAWRYLRHRDSWTRSRLMVTNDLVERMMGHRTRLAQQTRGRWHEGEDQAMSGLLALARRMDHSAMWLGALIPRGWLVLGLIGLTPSFAMANTSPGLLAIALGGVILAFRALQRFTTGLSHLAGAAIAWKQIGPLFTAANRPLDQGALAMNAISCPTNANGDGPPLIEAHELTFCYRDRGLPVLRECSLDIRPGDRIIIEGPSGGGKSTLASILAGLRLPNSGLLLWRGLDRQTVGLGGWRQRVAAAPQFHENHVLTGTFAFNLLMGGHWPPRLEEFQQAETVCRDLGLEGLLQRMPAGLLQLVGESGWQLSHGEKSRLYLARALLQGAPMVVLDESFAALDPENLRRALQCALDRTKTLVVIAHP
jgi:ATP-binding cassette subfamily B protein